MESRIYRDDLSKILLVMIYEKEEFFFFFFKCLFLDRVEKSVFPFLFAFLTFLLLVVGNRKL